MYYPREFKERVKKAYPELELLHQKLDKGDDFIFLYLKSINCMPSVVALSPGALSFYTVLEATSLYELKKRSVAEERAIFALHSSFSIDNDKEFDRRYTALSPFYPDIKQAKELLLAPLAFTAREIKQAKSLEKLHEEAVLRRERVEIIDACQNLYISQNS